MPVVSGITPDLRASCIAPNPPFLELVLATSQELSAWEQPADYSFTQREGNRHCPEGETFVELYKNLTTKMPVE